MASEIAHPVPAHVDGGASTLPDDASLTNGDHEAAAIVDAQPNAGAFDENTAISKTDTTIDTTNLRPGDAHPGGPTPIEDVAPGIAPVSDFLPKDAPASHPTPPPEPLEISESNLDVGMPDADSSSGPEVASGLAESSLVRPREDDDDDVVDEPVAKRSKVDEDRSPDVTMEDASETFAPDAPEAARSFEHPIEESLAATDLAAEPWADDSLMESQPSQPGASSVTNEDSSMLDQPAESDLKPQISEADISQSVAPAEPDAKPLAEAADPPQPGAPPESDVKPIVDDSSESVAPQETGIPSTEAAIPSQPIAPQKSEVKPPAGAVDPSQPVTPSKPTYSSQPMTAPQNKFLQEKMKNLKKTKSSIAFLNPVDPVLMNIPTYSDIVKNPMDLSTLEGKLKSGKYGSVQDFANDFDLIIHNTRAFNGDAHAVTQAGLSMEAYFRKMMETVPSAEQAVASKVTRREIPAASKASAPPPPRREPRATAAAAQPAAAARPAAVGTGAETFALQSNGTPQIRRESSINRPARAIKPPANREPTYPKPKRKETQLELKFCQHVLEQVRGPKYGHLNNVFQAPVDPVALNIPHYRQVVKKPMDLSTMAQKLKSGDYGKAVEFQNDFKLMVDNCIAFNPQGNPVRDIGIAFQRAFDVVWREKDDWEARQKGGSRRESTGSGEDENDVDEEDDEDEPPAMASETVAALQKQLEAIQNQLSSALNPPKKAAKKSKSSGKSTSRKAGSSAAAPKQKASISKPKAPKKPKQVTYEEKQEISDKVSQCSPAQMEAVTKIITSNCSKYAEQEEMELEIDDLPNHVQVMLLDYVRREFGAPNKRARAASPDDLAAMDDDDFEPAERGARRNDSRRKKHKPMGKKEQDESVSRLQKQLAQFQNLATSGSESPAASHPHQGHQQPESSGDESDDESEEE